MPRESFFSVKDIFQDRRKLAIFLICVLVSILSWMLISLGKSYSTTIIVPVHYINFPQNKTLLNEVPNQIAVNLTGSGYDLLQFDDRLTKDTLQVNLDNLKMSMQGKYQRGYLDQSLISNDLQERLNGVLAINRVLTDSINFLFDLKVARILKVKPRVEFEVAQGFVQVDSVEAIPQEVEVMGALSIIDTMDYIMTEKVDLGVLETNRQVSVALADPGFLTEGQSKKDSVSVLVKVDQLTEKSFLVAPQQVNVPDSLTMLTFPSSVEVTVQLPMSKYDEVNVEDFRMFVDYNRLESQYLVLPVELKTWPTQVEQLNITPNNVEIVVSRKE